MFSLWCFLTSMKSIELRALGMMKLVDFDWWICVNETFLRNTLKYRIVLFHFSGSSCSELLGHQ